MKKRLVDRRPSPAMVVAFIALCAGVTGGAYAAATIDGSDIVNGSITKKDLKKNSVNTKKVKNKTLLAKDFAPGQLKEGVQGIPGLQGEKGEKGDTGPRGPSDAYSTGDGFDATTTLPLTKDVPEGTYLVTATVLPYGPGAASVNVRCDLTGGSGSSATFVNIGNGGPPQHSQLTATMVTTFDADGTLTWTCIPASGVTYGYGNLQAVRVDSSN